MDIVLVNSTFSHNVLFAEFQLHPSCEEHYKIERVEFYHYVKNSVASRDSYIWQSCSDETQQPNINNHSYIVNVADGENKALIKVKARLNIISDTIIDCSCGVKSDDNGYYVERYFIDLTDLQERLLTQLDFGDDCILPNSYISELLKLFTLDVNVQNCSCDIEDIYKKFILNKKSHTISNNYKCGCNG